MYQQLIGLTLFISMATVNCVVNTVPCDFNKLCSCSGTTSPIREVNCLGLTINRIPKLPDNIHIYRLNIVNSPDVEYLLNNSLGLTLVSSLVVKRCGLLTIEPMAFNGTQSSLTTLDLSYNQLNNVPSLQGLTSLQWLSLKSNRLTNLNLNQWKHLFSSSLKELRNLIISDNLVTTIPDLIFNSITSLQSLDLDNNRIATIDGKPFPSSLTSLSLANNLLEKIPSEPLWSLNKLRWLNLRVCLISLLYH
uniref:LRRNT domain-containing protein n=1 Tax=Tetranychus urticae TaxID=32264 RepID=T1JRB3_TETUR